MGSKRTLAVVGLAVLITLAGCSAGAGGGSGDGGVAVSNGEAEYEQATDVAADRKQETGTALPTEAAGDSGGDAGGGADGGEGVRAGRDIIRTGTLVVEVEDFESAQSNLTATVRGYGGYVSDTRQDRREIGNETWIRGEIVLRVPSENFEALVNDGQALGEVQSVQTNSRDVTDQLVDIEARLENLRAERDRLRTLYERANTTEDVLAVQRELSDVQREIERIEARQQSLQNQVTFSTLTVRLEEPRPTPDRVAPDRWYDTPVLSAFLQSVDGAVVAVQALVVGIAFALPYLAVFGVPLALLVVGLRRYAPPIRGWRRSGGASGSDPESDAETESENGTEPRTDSE
jgi:hypothetical protein